MPQFLTRTIPLLVLILGYFMILVSWFATTILNMQIDDGVFTSGVFCFCSGALPLLTTLIAERNHV